MIYEPDEPRRGDPSGGGIRYDDVSRRPRISDADRLMLWRKRVADRYGMVPDWSDAGNLSKHMYAGAGPRPTTAGSNDAFGSAPETPVPAAEPTTGPHDGDDGSDGATSGRELDALAIGKSTEALIRSDVVSKFQAVPENRYHSLFSSTADPVFWTPARAEQLRRRLKGLDDTFNVGRRQVATTLPFVLRTIPFPLIAPPLIGILAARCRDPDHWYALGHGVSEMLPTARVNPSQPEHLVTAATVRHLDTTDHAQLERACYFNGHLWCTYHPNLYVHHTHRYLGHFVATPHPGDATDGTGPARVYTLSGHSYHNLLPNHVFRSNADYLNQRAVRMGLRQRGRGVARGSDLRRTKDCHNYFSLLDTLPAKLDAVHSAYMVPGLRRRLPRTAGGDVIIVPIDRRHRRRRGPVDGTLLPDVRRRSRVPGRVSWFNPSVVPDRATRVERLNRVFHHGLTDGLGRLGCNRSAHYHIYNNIGVVGNLLASYGREYDPQEHHLWGMENLYTRGVIDALRNPYAPVGQPEKHLFNDTDRAFRAHHHADREDMALIHGERRNDGTPHFGKPIFQYHQARRHGFGGRASRRARRLDELGAVQEAIDVYDARGLVESHLIRQDRYHDEHEYLPWFHQRLFDHMRMNPLFRRLYVGRQRRSLPLYTFCHPTYAEFQRMRGERRTIPWQKRLSRHWGSVAVGKTRSDGSRTSGDRASLDQTERLARQIITARSGSLRRLRSGYFGPDSTIDANRGLMSRYRDPGALAGSRAVPPGWVWRITGPQTTIRDALGETDHGAHILNALRLESPPVVNNEASGSVTFATAASDFGLPVPHDWDNGDPSFAYHVGKHNHELASDFTATNRHRRVLNVEYWPDARGRRGVLPTATVSLGFGCRRQDPVHARGLFEQLRDASVHEPTTSYTGYQTARHVHLNRLGRLKGLEPLKGRGRAATTYRKQALEVGLIRDAAWRIARAETRATFGRLGRREPAIVAALAQDTFHDLWNAWGHHGHGNVSSYRAATRNPIMRSDKHIFRERNGNKLVRHQHTFAKLDFDGEEDSIDPDLPHYGSPSVDWYAYDGRSRQTFAAVKDEMEDGFNSVEPYYEHHQPDHPMWSGAHPRRYGVARQAERLVPDAHDTRHKRRILSTASHEYGDYVRPVVRNEFDYGYDRAGGHAHHGRRWQARNHKRVSPDLVLTRHNQLWVYAYGVFLANRAGRKFYRLQDRYTLPVWTAFTETILTGNLRASLEHIWAQDHLDVHIGTNGLHRMVGGRALLRPFMPTITFLRGRHHHLNPSATTPPDVGRWRPNGDVGTGRPGRGLGLPLRVTTPRQEQKESTPMHVDSSRRGMLLVGPPGTGKTHIIRALAGEGSSRALVFGREKKLYRAVYGPDGEFANSIELLHLFELARQLTPCIVFIDEIDGLAPSRRHVDESLGVSTTGSRVLTSGRDFAQLNAFANWRKRGSNRPSFNLIKTASWHWRVTNPEIYNEIYTIKAPRRGGMRTIPSLDTKDEKPGFETRGLSEEAMLTLGHLLVQIDGIDVQNNVVVGATNRPLALDPALTRPGRLNRVVYVDLPSRQKRLELLRFYSRDRVAGPVDWDLLARRSAGLSPAHINAAINFSALINAYDAVASGQVTHDYQPHSARSLETGLRNVGFKTPGLQELYVDIGSRLNGGVTGAPQRNPRSVTPGGYAPVRVVLLETARRVAGVQGAGSSTFAYAMRHDPATKAVVTTLNRVPHALIGAIDLRQSYVNHYIRSCLIRERRKLLGSNRRVQPESTDMAVLSVRRQRRRGVVGSALLPTSADAVKFRAARLELYARHAPRLRRYFLTTNLDRGVNGRDPLLLSPQDDAPQRQKAYRDAEFIADTMHVDRDGVEAYVTFLELARRVLKKHLFGSTLLSSSGYACHAAIGAQTSPTYAVRGRQLITSDVGFSRYANLGPYADHLASSRDETVTANPRRVVDHVQRRMFADTRGGQRNAYSNAARALIRSQALRQSEDETVYHLWSLLFNDERAPSQPEFVHGILQMCSSRGEFEGYLAGLLAGRVGEYWLIRDRHHYASDLGTETRAHVGWLLNIMIENNNFYQSKFQMLKQTGVENLRQFYMKTYRVEKIQHDWITKEVRRRKEENDPGRFFTRRSAVFRPMVGVAARTERRWWRFELARTRKRPLGTADERWFRDRAERRRRVYYQRKFMANAAVVKSTLVAPDLPGLDRVYDRFVREFMGYFRASANQQLTSESEHLRVHMLFEVYELINHYLDDHRALFDYLIFQIMARGELDDTQAQRLVSRMLEIQNLDDAIAREWVDFERRSDDDPGLASDDDPGLASDDDHDSSDAADRVDPSLGADVSRGSPDPPAPGSEALYDDLDPPSGS